MRSPSPQRHPPLLFSVYALDSNLGLGPGADKSEDRDALSGHLLAEATLMGRYSR